MIQDNLLTQDKIRNIAIVAHVDHGKTTLVDHLLKQAHAFSAHQEEMNQETIMDSEDLERERGVTILAKNTAVMWNGHKINVLDTPGHADFGGEVERVLNMADGCVLLVDAAEGVLSQTKYVLSLAFAQTLRPIVIINKVDRKDQRTEEVVNEITDLFLDLAEDESQLEFPILYAIGRDGIAGFKTEKNEDGSLSITNATDLKALFETIIDTVPCPMTDKVGDFQMQVTTLDFDSHKGRYMIGKINRGMVKQGDPVAIVHDNKKVGQGRVEYLYTFMGLNKVEVAEARSGDIVAIAGCKEAKIGDTMTALNNPEGLPDLDISEPTMKIMISVSTSPLVGREGEFSTSRQLNNRLQRELETNVGLKIEDGQTGDSYYVSGRGELHLAVLIETMRREGYEFSVARPEVIFKTIDGKIHEPFEMVTIEVPEEHNGIVINAMGLRKGEMQNMTNIKSGVKFEYKIATRNLLGFRNDLLTQTSGMAVMHSQLIGYEPKGGDVTISRNGSLVSSEPGKALGYSLDNLQKRGISFVNPGDEVYKGMIVGQNTRHEDMYMNVCKGKKLSNMRSSSSDGTIKLVPATKMSLEQCLTWLASDELLEVTPKNLRLRKKDLNFKR